MPYTKQFIRLWKNVEEEYLGDPVPKRFQKRYGKIYDKIDTKSFAYAIANAEGIKIDKYKRG